MINAVKKTLNRIAKRNQSNQSQVWPLAGPQNLEEMKERIDRAQVQIKNGEGVATNQFNAELIKEFPWLCIDAESTYGIPVLILLISLIG